MTNSLLGYIFEDEPRITLSAFSCEIIPEGCKKVVTYPSLPGVVEMWVWHDGAWDIYDRVVPQ